MGATPVDFAYRVHTEVGNKCRGAKVAGRIVPLNSKLKTGDQVEILTAKNAVPSRDWLNTNLGYVGTSRARAKIVSWFRHQDRDSNISAGRGMLEAELKRMGISGVDYDELAESIKLQDVDEMFAKLGAGDLRTLQVVHAAQRLVEPEKEEDTFTFKTRPSTQNLSDSDVCVEGVGNLMTQMAKCCHPVPGDPIVGYITIGRGVSVHRTDCTNALQLREQEPDRVIEVNWGHKQESTYPVRIVIDAYDRSGLLRDITMVIANEKVNVTDMSTHTNPADNMAKMSFVLEISALETLGRVLAKLNQLPNVLDAHRDRKAMKTA